MTYTILLQVKPGYCAGDLQACAYPLTTAIHVAKDGETHRWYSCDVHAKRALYRRFRALVKFEALNERDVETLKSWGLTPKEIPLPTRVVGGREASDGRTIHVVSAKYPAECACGWRLYKATREQAIAAVERHLAKAVEGDFEPRRYNAETRRWEPTGQTVKVYYCVEGEGVWARRVCTEGSVGREAEHQEEQRLPTIRPALNVAKPAARDNVELPAMYDRSPYAKCGACGAAVRMKATKFSDGFLVLEYHTLEGRHQDAGIGYAGERCPAAFKRARKATKAEKAAWKAQAEAAKKAEQEAYNALVQASYETRRVMQDERARGA